MQLKVKLFAMLREQLGETVTLNLSDKATAEAVKPALIERFPAAKPILETARLAINQDFVADEAMTLAPGDEVALIPPVSGG
ncbi:MoaD/ThiS family protein [Secundilactobacillus kimchicus]|uniref:MoaD/ThiS family protein n=1 Tax=Secundilactobacillus kimchicus TaxID=528209 RepID=UPI0024A867A2|nr:MoaD/ThiS family protein [Secundilactobacillus kimchicus]